MNDRNNNNIYKEVMLKLYHQAQMDGENSSRLPTLRQLAEQFHCTHPTVLRAVRELVKRDVLIQLKNGDYRTVPQFASKNTRYLAMVYAQGMNLLEDSYSVGLKYFAVKHLILSPEHLRFSEIHASSPGDIEAGIRSGIYCGAVLCNPRKDIMPVMTESCRSAGIPLGVFGGHCADAADVSITYDVRNNFLMLFERLIQRKRRRVLVLSQQHHEGNDGVREAMNEVSGYFEKAEFMTDSVTRIADYLLQNTGGSGVNFDCVVYMLNIFDTYEKLQTHAPDCLCAMPEFSSCLENDFRGLVLRYDLENAGRQFGRAMSAVLNRQTPDNPKGFIPCSIQEVP